MKLPTFKYHPDPLATGAVIASDTKCVCCAKARGYVYAGPVFAEDEHEECICPWCIADGSAHQKLDATFTDEEGIGGGSWEEVADEIVDEISYRTPGFSGWQQERWWTHCGDAAQFLGRAGRVQLEGYGPEVINVLRVMCEMDKTEWKRVFQVLDRDGSPTAYVFRCAHCGQYGGYVDGN